MHAVRISESTMIAESCACQRSSAGSGIAKTDPQGTFQHQAKCQSLNSEEQQGMQEQHKAGAYTGKPQTNNTHMHQDADALATQPASTPARHGPALVTLVTSVSTVAGCCTR